MSSYTSPDEARSDLFLSGATFLFGGLLLNVLLQVTGIGRLAGVGTVLAFVVPLLLTVLVPVLLMRYRGESLADLGVGGGGDDSAVPAIVAALPIIAAAFLTAVLAGEPLSAQVPALRLGGPTVAVLTGVVSWVGLSFLALYCTVKARDAFRGEPQGIDDSVVRVGRFLGIACGGALVLLILGSLGTLDSGGVLALLAYPIGIAAAVAVALRFTSGASTTTMPSILTPTVLLALGPFGIVFNARAFVSGIYFGALYAGIGLIIAIIAERTRRGRGVLLLGLIVALATGLPVGIRGL